MPLQTMNRFTVADLNTSKELIVSELSIIVPTEPPYTALPRPIFLDCDTTSNPHTVKITFDVSYITPSAASPIYEQPEKSRATAKQPGALKRLLSVVKPQPTVGFTSGKNLLGAGVEVDLKNSVLESLSVEGAGASSSGVGSASMEGSRDFASAWLRNLRWRGGYEYSNLPAEDGLDIKKGTGYVQFFANTRAFGDQPEENAFGKQASKEIIFRYGVSLEGGNRQTNLDQNSALITDVVSGDYESLKTYVGASWRLRRHKFKTSYGLQLGGTNGDATDADVRTDFIKHIFDSAYKTRFYPWSNRPMSVEAQFTAGKINRRGVLPVAERFFGGNVEQNFIGGADWAIRSVPFIRSFPQQRLSRTGLPSAVGGESFVSFNTTYVATFWAKPAIDREVQREIPTAFRILRDEAKAESLRIALTTLFVSETPSYVEQIAKADLKSLKTDLSNLQSALQTLLAQGVAPETEDLIAECDDAIVNALDIIKEAQKKIVFDAQGQFVSNGLDATLELQELVKGFPPAKPTSPPNPAALTVVIKALDEVHKQTDAPIVVSRTDLNNRRTTLQNSSDALELRYDNFQTSGLPAARALAIKFLDDTESQILTVGRELNAFSIGPVVMFDAARIRSQGGREGFRYGVGSGLQFEFFGLELRGGYSFNPDRRPGEPKGSFTFSFGVGDFLQ
ncbi:MAG TPA: hypothetical protein VF666_04375 [Pyrinomonadaceae bacterium]